MNLSEIGSLNHVEIYTLSKYIIPDFYFRILNPYFLLQELVFLKGSEKSFDFCSYRFMHTNTNKLHKKDVSQTLL